MTFLTRIAVNKSRRETMLILARPERLHAAIYAGFPTVSNEGNRRDVLWRMDEQYSGPVIYVVSSSRPDYTGFVESYGWPRRSYGDQVKTVSYDAALASIRDGDTLRFRVSASTQIRRSGTLTPVTGISSQEEWLQKRAQPNGFAIGSMTITKAGSGIIDSRNHLIRFPWAQYDGILTVNDREAFTMMLSHGLGREKAYGMGLMTVYA